MLPTHWVLLLLIALGLARWPVEALSLTRQRPSTRRGAPTRLYLMHLPHAETLSSSTSLLIADAAEDLPNILGINPIEAAIIFGVLYYVYGSEVLYEYAREAGRLFSTYGPIVKDVSLDIFYEFREYLEEDRERAALKKTGVDIDNIPRRTTNILEKFTETFATFSELASGKSEAGELKEAYGGIGSFVGEGADNDLVRDEETDRAARRKSKREVLSSRNVDVERIMDATDVVTRGEELSTTGLSESISAVKERLSALGASAGGGVEDGASSTWEGAESLLFPSTEGEGWGEGTRAEPEANPAFTPASTSARAGAMVLSGSTGAASALGMSKFQQQMSGEWNSRVLRKDKYEGGDSPSSRFDEDNDVDGDMTISFLDKWERAGSVPQDIFASDSPAVVVAAVGGVVSNRAREVLLEIDRDYQRLRQRLIDLLEEPSSSHDEIIEVQSPTVSSASVDSAVGGRKYWPPLSR